MSGQQLQEALNLRLAGRGSDAARVYQEILSANPSDVQALQSLGTLYLHGGEFERAQSLLGQAARLNPHPLESLCLRGIALLSLRRFSDALACFDDALALKPDFVEALTNRAVTLLELRRLDDALSAFDAALAAQPEHAAGWYNRGNTLLAMKRLREAVKSYDRALAIQSEFPEARNNRLSVLFELGEASRCPPRYLRRTFDEFSAHYDETMLNRLGYRGHVHLRQLAELVLPRMTPPWRILDLGAGTGLVGEVFKDLAQGGRLDGIDLSPLMIAAARHRAIYNDLILGDLETVLASPGPTYDLILAADTMSYLGDLAPTLSGVAGRLEPGGFYLFVVERMSGDSWEQTPRKVFRHSESYVRREAARAGLRIAKIVELSGDWSQGSRAATDIVLHKEVVPVNGLAIALQRPEQS